MGDWLKRYLKRWVLFIEFSVAVAILGVWVIMLNFTYISNDQFLLIKPHFQYVSSLRELERDLEASIDASPPFRVIVSADAANLLRQQIAEISQMNANLADTTPERLKLLYQQLETEGSDLNLSAVKLSKNLDDIIDQELIARESVMMEISAAADAEKDAIIVMSIIIPLAAFGLLLMFRHTISRPAQKIADLLTGLGGQDFAKVDVDVSDVSPTLQPVLENYNKLVDRLKELEADQAQRQTSLEQQVQLTTSSLIRLQRTLANTEKLAMAGEIAASIAHELRNPLAGIRAALGNLQEEIEDPEQTARLNLLIGELKRMTSLLNYLLEQAKFTPESLVQVNLETAILEVAQLAKLQLSEIVKITFSIDADLSCNLPEDRFRQTIMNLILNSGQAIGNQPGSIVVGAVRNNDQLEISVSDNGPGFPEEIIQSGVRSFFTKRDHGTGLGLAIVRRLANDLGGSLKISNVEPSGAQVVLTLPCENHDD